VDVASPATLRQPDQLVHAAIGGGGEAALGVWARQHRAEQQEEPRVLARELEVPSDGQRRELEVERAKLARERREQLQRQLPPLGRVDQQRVPVAKGAEHCLAAPREGIEAYDALPERTLWKALDQLACDLVRQ